MATVASRNSFVELPSMKYIHVNEPAVLLADGRVFVPDSVGSEIFDPQSNTFTTGPSSVCQHADCAATLLPDGTVFVVGASGAQIFDPTSNSSISLSSLGCHNRHTATVTLLPNGRVLIAGGCKDLRAEVYDPVSHTFSFTGKMVSYRSESVATLLGDGMVLVTGGRTYDGKILSTCETYDFRSGAFIPVRSMNSKRYGHTTTLLADGRVLVAGKLPDQKGPSAELFDPKNGTFLATGNMSSARMDHTASPLASGDVLLTGGFGWRLHSMFRSLVIEDQSSVELYHPSSGRFTRSAPLSIHRRGHSATLLLDGRVLIAGGSSVRWYQLDESYAYAHAAELYLPKTTGSQRTVRALFALRSNSGARSGWIFVSGSGFISGDTLLVDGQAQPTTYLSSALLSTPFSGSLSAENAGVHEIRVRYSVSAQSGVSEPVRLQAPNSLK